jgi:tetratricopeptide (TPR) repeat protein
MAEATDIYSKVFAQGPGSAEIHLNYGYALFKSDQTQEAIDAYRAAIRLNPGLGLAHINLGSALSELDQDKEAIAAFRIGLKTHANHVEGLIGLARCLRAQDEYEDAAASFKKALDLAKDQSNDRSAVYWELGYSLELSGDKDGGRTAYEKCLEHHSRSWCRAPSPQCSHRQHHRNCTT